MWVTTQIGCNMDALVQGNSSLIQIHHPHDIRIQILCTQLPHHAALPPMLPPVHPLAMPTTAPANRVGMLGVLGASSVANLTAMQPPHLCLAPAAPHKAQGLLVQLLAALAPAQCVACNMLMWGLLSSSWGMVRACTSSSCNSPVHGARSVGATIVLPVRHPGCNAHCKQHKPKQLAGIAGGLQKLCGAAARLGPLDIAWALAWQQQHGPRQLP